jgi:hypothetical protein
MVKPSDRAVSIVFAGHKSRVGRSTLSDDINQRLMLVEGFFLMVTDKHRGIRRLDHLCRKTVERILQHSIVSRRPVQRLI